MTAPNLMRKTDRVAAAVDVLRASFPAGTLRILRG